MTNIYGVPEITVQEVAHLRTEVGSPILLDVREAMELKLANLGEAVIWVPLSKIAAERLASLPPELADKSVEVVVFCHTGVRSAQVAAWLRNEGWINIVSLAGGIETYALEIDPKVGRY
ncbi:MAG TPA: rhodanese-like domain-containing protein [Patescibacteria group bacterium]|jgi:rhodanese-related sulfurtransferase|nr:rhodanese-like domain-containing protein [Patescibacteria group bacterium]